ncbi:indolepyruvate ferredoxin oxidoreductase family protein [Niveibacterium sp. SC-1]|uniref:indolepyruvate ferredoxin oxidoreductase family protein n=1 Tax=Niveibacterium sp. SC-1 TaxID=3135646 RepID=UPI00311F2FBE
MPSTLRPTPETPSQRSLDDKYLRESGRVFINGHQALVRLPMLQRERDRTAGLNTAGFVSGYRGSPLGGLDMAFAWAKPHLQAHDTVFQPGINEDMAATAVWGTQQVGLHPGARVDGVFALWYGKGPGVDRCGDVFRHGNAAGSAAHGGVLVIAGDDHAAKSSTLPHQTDHFFKSMMMPVLAPSGVQEYLDLGIHGWALSRYSGCWVAFKAVSDTVETTASVEIAPGRVRILLPEDFALPPDGLNIRWPDPPLVQERRLLHYKLYAALAYCRVNQLNSVILDSPRPRLGILTCGKSYLDVRQALDDLGIDAAAASAIGLRLYKAGMVWPLEAEGIRAFARGLDEILVVEEKRQLLEYQLKEELYNWREDVRPRVVGKFDEKGEWALLPTRDGKVDHGDWLLPAAGELTPALIARAMASRIARFHDSERIRARLDFLARKEHALAGKTIRIERPPAFCAGCPHNTSTHVPEGSRAVAGIGCHYMATWMPDRRTSTFTQMGGEGANWVGQAPFTETRHIFANLGDGTYFHSGLLAIRQAVAAFNGPHNPQGSGITYKILYNDAVAMTGGQAVDGPLDVPRIVAQLKAEGVHNIVVVTDGTPRDYGPADLGHVPVRMREELDAVQRELRELPGVSALIYDQTCAAEKRRRRKRGRYPDPARRVFINEAVCEGCGDCGEQSSCMAVLPLETEFGRKRTIDQSACNKDYSCLEGFCPSFVAIEGGRPRRGRATLQAPPWAPPPAPALPSLATPYGILIGGVGGTGIVTLGALIGMAAHIDGKGVTVLDMTGLAQKGGAVFSHVRIAQDPGALHAVRIATGEADALIGGDLIVSTSDEALSRLAAGRSRVVVNSAETPTLAFTRDPDWQFPLEGMQAGLREAVGSEAADFLDATQLATRLLGDAIATNLFLLGFAWQRGLIPVSETALQEAITLNGVAIELNRAAFLWGRHAACRRPEVEQLLAAPSVLPLNPARSIDELIRRRSAFLSDYQNAAWARRYEAAVQRIRSAESSLDSQALTDAVARGLFKFMSYKDEYEVARLYSRPEFLAEVAAQFEGDYSLRIHLAPPLWARADPLTGRIRKTAYRPWVLRAFRWLARGKRLRGTRFDPFGWLPDRRLEREMLAQYETDLQRLARELDAERLPLAVQIAALPEQVRGFGHIKRRNHDAMRRERHALWLRWEAARGGRPPLVVVSAA